MSILPRWWFVLLALCLALWAGGLAIGAFEGSQMPALQVVLLVVCTGIIGFGAFRRRGN